MAKVCKNCKFFEKGRPEHSFGDCLNPKFVYAEDMDTDKRTDDMLIYSDYEMYEASFSVGQNFGCVHFKKGTPKVIDQEPKAVWVPFEEMKNLMKVLKDKTKEDK